MAIRWQHLALDNIPDMETSRGWLLSMRGEKDATVWLVVKNYKGSWQETCVAPRSSVEQALQRIARDRAWRPTGPAWSHTLSYYTNSDGCNWDFAPWSPRCLHAEETRE